MTLRRLDRDPAGLGSLSLYAQIDETLKGTSVADADRQSAALGKIADGLAASLLNPSRLQGWRTQAMFEAMLLGLGGLELLTTEDEGNCYFDDSAGGVAPPDFRIVTSDQEHLLAEVKNVAPKDTMRPATIRKKDLSAMQRYADLTGARLVVAHYWAGLNTWTLVDSSVLSESPTQMGVTCADAMKANELGRLGDRMIGTKPPLILSVRPSKGSEPAVAEQTGEVSLKIGSVSLSAGGNKLRTAIERAIAFQLMVFGSWNVTEHSEVRGGKLLRHDFVFRPYDPEGEEAAQGFSVVATLSSLHAARWAAETIGDAGEVQALRLEPDPGALTRLVPPDYWDRSFRGLKLWSFAVRPA